MLEFLVYAGAALSFIYLFVALHAFLLLWRRVKPENARAVIVKVAAALCWPYVVYQVFTEALD